MRTLTIPLHMPVKAMERFMHLELRSRNIVSVKVGEKSMIVTHEPRLTVDDPHSRMMRD